MSISPQQCLMARAGLGLTNAQLAEKANVGINTVSRFENGLPTLASSASAIRIALEDSGAVFLDRDEVSMSGGRGVRLPREQ
jgi:transcriptional regulator with XRE-family HTH domain